MPEIKHNFTTGKMNKDLDERLVQNGEYRDAMNVQVSTSDESDIGTVQNILGNSLISDISYLTEDAVCIASIDDEKNDTIYWFVYDNNNSTEQSFIFQYDKQSIKIVFADLDNTVLKFSKNYITAINIIDDLLFFTDGINEPKKINIKDCLNYTVQNGSSNTQILLEKGDPDILTRRLESHITVIKKAPLKSPTIEYNYTRDPLYTHTGVITTTKNQEVIHSFLGSSQGQVHDFSNLDVGDSFNVIIESDINGNNDFTLNWSTGTDVVISPYDASGNPPEIPVQNYALKGFIEDWEDNVFSNETLLLPIKYTNRGTGWTEIIIRNSYSFNGTQYRKISSRPWHVGTETGEQIIAGNQYKIKFTLAEDSAGDLEGRILVRLFDNTGHDPITGAGNGGTNHYVVIAELRNLATSDAGEYEFDFTPQNYPGTWGGNSPNYGFVEPSNGWPSFTGYGNCLQFEARTNNGSGEDGKVFKGIVKDFSITRLDSKLAKVKIRINSKNPDAVFSPVDVDSLNYVVDTYENNTSIFKDRLARFSYRYKYVDNEYSYFSPFTSVVFSPGKFAFNSLEAYNLGMVNNVKSVTLSNFNYKMPEDVKSIDILYKSEDSPSVYVVDTIKNNDLDSSYTLTSETIKLLLPEDQFLRTYDNVPRTAKAQEIIGNRLVYGNYKQNYDLVYKNENNDLVDFNINMDTRILSTQNPTDTGAPSVKSQRKYQVGVVYLDEYGRTTPVQTNSKATVELDIENSVDINQVSVMINSLEHPVNMKYFKFYIKDTGGEYYNLAMDRWYDAEDGNVWLAFPSSDRDKVKIDDFLILKKGIGKEDTGLIKDNKYKVVDIQSEAPDFIKRVERFASKKGHSSNNLLFDTIPAINQRSFSVLYSRYSAGALARFNETFANRQLDTEYFICLGDGINTSNKYKILDVVLDDGFNNFTFNIEGTFGSDVAQFSDDPNNISFPTEIINGVSLSIFINKVESSPKFDGRFFVKIFKDANYSKFINKKIDEENVEYSVLPKAKKRIYYCKSHSSAQFNGPTFHGGTNPLINGDPSAGDFWGIGTTHNDYTAYDTPSSFTMSRSCVAPTIGKNSPQRATLAGFMDANKNVIREVSDYSYSKDAGDTADPFYRPKSWLNYLAWKAWFRGINTDQTPSFSNRSRKNFIDLVNDKDNQAFEDVWYINETRFNHGMPYQIGNPKGPGGWVVSKNYPTKSSIISGPGKFTQVNGLDSWASSSQLNLSFGAIEAEKSQNFKKLKADQTNYSQWYHKAGYYDLQNHSTYGPLQGDFVKQLSAGSQFRFKQDPSKTIYTIQDVSIQYILQYDNLEESSLRNPGNNKNHIIGQLRVYKGDSYKKSSGADQYGNEYRADGKTLAGLKNDVSMKYRSAPFLDPVNYVINYKLTLDKPIVWNPVESHGSPISGGVELQLAAADANPAASVTGGLFQIQTDTITGVNNNENVLLEVGMVLESYNDASNSNAVQSLAKKAIVSSINFNNSKYTIKFRAYNGADETLDSADSAGNIPNIDPGDALNFKQYSMNGLSPNSAKNLNFFRDGSESSASGNSGVAALGYDIEFVEIANSGDTEDLVPTSPAVWETEHKEINDIDIYYEASDVIPLLKEGDTLENIIPVGSKIEHVSSAGTGVENSVASINGNVITLENAAQVIATVPLHQDRAEIIDTNLGS
tara:strand:+ start:341 stop:5347 length:5007 start_codon:yes stop_codon:yes gene_type:complete